MTNKFSNFFFFSFAFLIIWLLSKTAIGWKRRTMSEAIMGVKMSKINSHRAKERRTSIFEKRTKTIKPSTNNPSSIKKAVFFVKTGLFNLLLKKSKKTLAD